jgi:hypothetical protein
VILKGKSKEKGAIKTPKRNLRVIVVDEDRSGVRFKTLDRKKRKKCHEISEEIFIIEEEEEIKKVVKGLSSFRKTTVREETKTL